MLQEFGSFTHILGMSKVGISSNLGPPMMGLPIWAQAVPVSPELSPENMARWPGVVRLSLPRLVRWGVHRVLLLQVEAVLRWS